MNPEILAGKHRLFMAAMTSGDFETAEALAVEIEPYMQIIEDDCMPGLIPAWGTSR